MRIPPLTLADVLEVLAPDLSVAGAQSLTVDDICIDSREALANSLFVALEGDHTDGHEYVQDAFSSGATVALVNRVVADGEAIDTTLSMAPGQVLGPAQLVVPDTLAALQQLAKARRDASPGLAVVGVTGSVGKTVAKEAIAAVLTQRFLTLKSEGNQNNEIGLPLTLMRIAPKHGYLVAEMGMYALGEIALLCEIARPIIGVVTNVGPTHLERLGTIERIAQAKAELVEALPADGVAVLNGDDPRVRDMGQSPECDVITFGLTRHNTVWADRVVATPGAGTRFDAHVQETRGLRLQASSRTLHTKMLGRHSVWTALPAIAVGLLQGLTWDEIQSGLSAVGRGLRLVPRVGIRGTTILDDAYNSSPASAIAALKVLGEWHAWADEGDHRGRRIAVLGDMLELGAYEDEGHLTVGRQVASAATILVAVGPRAVGFAQGAMEAGMLSLSIHTVADSAQALPLVQSLLHEGDMVLVKGSRGMAMEHVVSGLVAEGESEPDSEAGT